MEKIKEEIQISAIVLVCTEKGYIFKKEKNSVSFLKALPTIRETSLDCAKRILAEQVKHSRINFQYRATLEFFENEMREICFVYSIIDFMKIITPNDLIEIPESDIPNLNIEPVVVKQFMLESIFRHPSHFILK